MNTFAINFNGTVNINCENEAQKADIQEKINRLVNAFSTNIYEAFDEALVKLCPHSEGRNIDWNIDPLNVELTK